jgi:hypothetical protein
MSANDPKRTSAGCTTDPYRNASLSWYDVLSVAARAAMRRRNFIKILGGAAADVWPRERALSTRLFAGRAALLAAVFAATFATALAALWRLGGRFGGAEFLGGAF